MNYFLAVRKRGLKPSKNTHNLTNLFYSLSQLIMLSSLFLFDPTHDLNDSIYISPPSMGDYQSEWHHKYCSSRD